MRHITLAVEDDLETSGVINLSYRKDDDEDERGTKCETEKRVRWEEKKEAEVKEKSSEEKQEEPPDGGWGWVVTFGCVLIAIAINIAGPCFGILFSGFLLDLGTSSTNVAWIFNFRSLLVNISSFFLDPLVAEFGWRKVGLVASFLLALGFGISTFADSALYLLCSYSVLTGIGGGLLMGIIFSIIPYYFNRKRGLANAIMHVGISIGQMAGPPMITFLQETYAFAGSSLVLSAILLNGCLGAAVLHPVAWHMKSNGKAARRKTGKPDLTKPETEKRSAISRIFAMIVNNTKLLRSPRVLIIAVGSSLNVNAYLNFLMAAPFALQESGFTLEETSWCMSVSGFCMLISRLVVSWLTDLPKVSKRLCHMMGSATVLITTIAFTFTKSLTWASIVIGLWACGVGTFMSLHSLIMVEYVGLDKLVPTLGACGIFSSLTAISVGPIIGLIRDVSQSYAVSMWALSTNFGITFCLWIFMPAAVAFDKRREERQKSSS